MLMLYHLCATQGDGRIRFDDDDVFELKGR